MPQDVTVRHASALQAQEGEWGFPGGLAGWWGYGQHSELQAPWAEMNSQGKPCVKGAQTEEGRGARETAKLESSS